MTYHSHFSLFCTGIPILFLLPWPFEISYRIRYYFYCIPLPDHGSAPPVHIVLVTVYDITFEKRKQGWKPTTVFVVEWGVFIQREPIPSTASQDPIKTNIRACQAASEHSERYGVAQRLYTL